MDGGQIQRGAMAQPASGVITIRWQADERAADTDPDLLLVWSVHADPPIEDERMATLLAEIAAVY
jgi:hypothetical protein